MFAIAIYKILELLYKILSADNNHFTHDSFHHNNVKISLHQKKAIGLVLPFSIGLFFDNHNEIASLQTSFLCHTVFNTMNYSLEN
jgi:hypothetical protein